MTIFRIFEGSLQKTEPVVCWARMGCVCWLLSVIVFAFPRGSSFAQSADVGSIKVELGFGGRIKLGCWQPFWVVTPDRLEPQRFEMTVLDGDETPITYQGPLHAVGSALNQHQGYLKLGKGFGTATIKLFDREGSEVGRHSFSLRQTGESQIVPPTDPLVLIIEPERAVADAISSTSIGVGNRTKGSGIKLGHSSQLPVDAFCYEGIDAVFLVTSNVAWLESVSQLQWNALEDWVANGGQLILSINPLDLKLFNRDAPLARFVAGQFAGSATLNSSGRLDGFVSSTSLLKPGSGDALTIAKIENPQGMVTIEQDGHPLVVRTPVGFGEILLVAMDLNDAKLTQWTGYKNLVYRLQHHIQLQEAAQNQRVSSRGGSVSHPGYDDLIGQLRVPLDQFSNVRFLSFNWIAVLIGLYILCIGPGDYFFLRRVTGKMELTWITFPLISLFFCGLAVWIAHQTRADRIQLNQLEVIDIEAESGLVRGTAWSNLYSPYAGDCQISVNRANRMNVDVETDLVCWHGLPGKGYGGMQTQSGAGMVQREYYHAREALTKDRLDGYSRLEKMPLFVSSTKPLLVQYRGKFVGNGSGKIQSNLKLRSKVAGLEGTLVNPFDFPLKNCRLLFENSAYELSEPLDVGEAIAVESEMKERTLVGYLTRRRTVSDEAAKSTNTQNLPWDINEARISRIADMLMFYSAAGGSNYTAGLTHDYHNFVDLSEHLNLGRAILVAEIDGLGTSLMIDGASTDKNYDQAVTIVRIVLPVSYMEKRR